jgi:polysaccharide export outer membrane protein
MTRKLVGDIFVIVLTSTITTQAQDPRPAGPLPPAGTAQPAVQDAQPGTPPMSDPHARYRLRAGEVLDIHFQFTPEFNQTVTVQPDGYVALREVGEIRVADKTVPEVVAGLQTAYGKILRDPAITVELKDFEKPYFIVGGQVVKPGKYDLRGDTTVVQAVQIAGGFDLKSKKSEILLFRRVSDDWVEVNKVDLNRMMRQKDLSQDLRLLPGDMVLVPTKSGLSNISRFIPVPSLGMYFNPLPF